MEQYEARAHIAKALAHPTRLLLLDALQGHKLCVGELTKLAGTDQSTVSRHLAVLKNAGLVGARKGGTTTYYSITCPCLGGFFECIETVLQRNLRTYQALARG